jgi:DNA-binding HxlR family transcriptional regulator
LNLQGTLREGAAMDGYIRKSTFLRGDVTCPIAVAAEVLSDQWSVVIIRDIAFFERRTFGCILKHNNEKIARPTLANRLRRLHDIGIIIARDDKSHSQRKIYSLTERGLSLLPILVEMANWSMNQSDIASERINFLAELANGPSELMNEFIENLKISQNM